MVCRDYDFMSDLLTHPPPALPEQTPFMPQMMRNRLIGGAHLPFPPHALHPPFAQPHGMPPHVGPTLLLLPLCP